MLAGVNGSGLCEGADILDESYILMRFKLGEKREGGLSITGNE